MITDWTTRGAWEILSGTTILPTATIKALLVTSAYVFSDAHEFVAAITNEVTGGGYTRQLLAGKSVVKDLTNGEAYLACSNLQFLNLTATNIDSLCLYRDMGSDATSPYLCRIRFPAPITRSAANLDILIPANGLVALAVRAQG